MSIVNVTKFEILNFVTLLIPHSGQHKVTEMVDGLSPGRIRR